MKVKKQKQFRRTVKFFKACFGFREPFKVLCDGNFLHYALEQRLGAPQDTLPALLGGAAKAFTTRCIIAELKKLGESFSGTVLAARRIHIAKCDHEPLKSGSECLEGLIGADNPEHFFLATQDVELRKKFRMTSGCALIFAKTNCLFLEPPSEYQLSISRAEEAERSRMKEKEQRIIQAREKRQRESLQEGINDEPELFDSNEPPRVFKNQKDVLAVRKKSIFKRKRAKGPNPLSCKKKTKKPAMQPKPENSQSISTKKETLQK